MVTRLRDCWACGTGMDYDEHLEFCQACGAKDPNGEGRSPPPLWRPPDGTIDGDGVWRGGKWHPNHPENHAIDHTVDGEGVKS